MIARSDLRSASRAELEALLRSWGEPPHRGRQVFRWLHGRGAGSAAAMTDLPRPLRERLDTEFDLAPLELRAETVAADGTRKLALRTRDGVAVETVVIPEAGAVLDDDPDETGEARPPEAVKLTQCVSSQTGCALGCRFCATATLGPGRSLTAGEIVEQVYLARRPTDPRARNVVFMGMGEPLLDVAALVRAVHLLGDDHGAGISPRRITVSTAGVVPGLERLGHELPGIGLAVSLHAATDALRGALMPIGRRWPLAALLAAVRALPLPPRRRITFEYVLLAGVNDGEGDARALARLLRGIRCKVNLLAFNEWPGAPFERPSEIQVARFQQALQARGLPVYVRRSRGGEIAAACGQLAAGALRSGAAAGALLP
jgi:23S rRNA (adenine2503-C2)-methyltransferase